MHTTITRTQKTTAIALAPGEVEAFNVIGGSVRILLDGTASGGAAFMFETSVAPGDGPPLHRHEREDELFYVLDGEFLFVVNGTEFRAAAGAFAFAPRGSVHTFVNAGTIPGRMLVTCTPAGMEIPFRATKLPAPGSERAALSLDQIAAEFARHGIEMQGPPLTVPPASLVSAGK